MKNITGIISLFVFVLLVTLVAQTVTGCKPSSGDYGVFDLRSDNPEKPAAETIKAVVSGKVVDNGSKTGQAGLPVKLFAVDNTLLRQMNSTADGSFLFADVTPGTYLLETAAASAQFETATYTILVNSDASTLPKTISLIVYPKGFSADILVDIHGKVTASNTSILEKDVVVDLHRVVNNVRDAAVLLSATTQAKGLFLFPQQEPGIYDLVLSKAGLEDVYRLIINDKGVSVPEIPLELIISKPGD
jgi:hypothetical protein